jgi:hypothetical protein
VKTLARRQPAAEPIQFANGQGAPRTRATLKLHTGEVERNSWQRSMAQKLESCDAEKSILSLFFNFSRLKTQVRVSFSISKRATTGNPFWARNVESHDGWLKE